MIFLNATCALKLNSSQFILKVGGAVRKLFPNLLEAKYTGF
jgi:hypothetical protein